MSTSTMSLQTVSLTSTINISTAIVSSDTTSIVPTSSTTVTTSLNSKLVIQLLFHFCYYNTPQKAEPLLDLLQVCCLVIVYSVYGL